MTELILGTKKGLFVVDGTPESGFEVTTRAFAGEPVDYARRDPRTGRLFATVSSPFYGPKIWYADDPGGEWSQADGVSLPEGGDAALERIWVITPGQADGLLYAGGDPGVLFESHDDGATWELNEAFWNHPRAAHGSPAAAVCACTRSSRGPATRSGSWSRCRPPGVWLTDDAGRSWRQGNRGLVARYLPEETRETATNLCVHHIERSPSRPERLFMQFHGGVYRSDDAGESWSEIGAGLDVGLRVPADGGSRGSRQRVCDPSARRRGPRDSGGPRSRVRDSRRRLQLDRARERTASDARLPDDSAPRVRPRGERVGPRAVLRLDVGRGVRDGGRRGDVVERHLATSTRVLADGD